MQLNTIPLFNGASPEFLDELEKSSISHDYKKGKILFIHEEEAESFYFIRTGWVKLFRETLDGAQSIVDILPAGHIFGECAIFDGNLYSYSAEVVESSIIVKAPLSILKKEIESNNQVALNMLASMAKHRLQQDNELEHRTVQSAPQRIGCFLLRLIDQEKDGKVSIHLPYDKTLIASRLGMQPETFSRALAKLKEHAGVRVRGATIVIEDVGCLVEYTCLACSHEFPCKDLACGKS